MLSALKLFFCGYNKARDMFIATAVAPLKPGGHSRNDFDHDIVKQMATEVGFCTKIARKS